MLAIHWPLVVPLHPGTRLVYAPGDELPVEAMTAVDAARVEDLTAVQVTGRDSRNSDLYIRDRPRIDTRGHEAAVI